MSRFDDALQQLQSQGTSRIRFGSHPSDDALITLMVHMALSDGVLDDAELAMLQPIVPDKSTAQLKAWIDGILATPLDLEALADDLDTDDRRWTALRFAARMAMRDQRVADEERAFLSKLATALSLPAGALARVVREMAGPLPTRLDPEALRAMLTKMQWGAADFAPGHVESGDLVPLIPATARPVARIGVDQSEVIGIYDQGILGRFLEGPAFLSWQRIVGCTRGAGLESSVRIHTDDGRIWSLVDARLSGIALLLDRLYRDDDTSDGDDVAPRIVRVRGDQDW